MLFSRVGALFLDNESSSNPIFEVDDKNLCSCEYWTVCWCRLITWRRTGSWSDTDERPLTSPLLQLQYRWVEHQCPGSSGQFGQYVTLLTVVTLALSADSLLAAARRVKSAFYIRDRRHTKLGFCLFFLRQVSSAARDTMGIPREIQWSLASTIALYRAATEHPDRCHNVTAQKCVLTEIPKRQHHQLLAYTGRICARAPYCGSEWTARCVYV